MIKLADEVFRLEKNIIVLQAHNYTILLRLNFLR